MENGLEEQKQIWPDKEKAIVIETSRSDVYMATLEMHIQDVFQKLSIQDLALE